MHRRSLMLAVVLALTPTFALADESIAGQWQAQLGHHSLIAMDVLADGYWTSQTVQNNKVVAQMAGSYTQTKQNGKSGTLVFTPVKSKVTAAHGAAEVETDHYALADHGNTLRLTSTSGGAPMMFHKQPLKK